MSIIDWMIVIIPFAFVLYVAWVSRKYVKGVADFLAAGRVCGRYVISVADVAGALAVITLVGHVEGNYKTGFAIAFWSSLGVPLSIVLALTGFCFYRFRETKAMSFGQFLEMRYNKSFRIFAATLRTFSETLANMIVPAVSARFFICLIGLPYTYELFGIEISTFGTVIILALLLALFIIWCGGTVSLIITDALQAIISYPIFAVMAFYVISHFSWFDEIVPVMADRVAGESFLNPYDIESLRDFNLFALIVTLMNSTLNRASWIGAGSTAAAKTPHEQKMAGVLGSWRNGFSWMFFFLVAAMLIATLTHNNYAGKAREIRADLTTRAAIEAFPNDETREKYAEAINQLPVQNHVFGVDEPFSQQNNPDTPYLDTALEVLNTEENSNANFQQFRTLYYQQMLPVTMRYILPTGLLGLLVLLMVMLMVSTDDSRIFSGALTIVQDIVLPVYNKPISRKTHLLLLRLATLFIGVLFFFGSFFMAQLDYINLFCIITTSIWLGGAGPVMLGGLYTRFGNTAGAYASLAAGTLISGGGVLVQRNWPDHIYPWLERMGWAESFGNFLETVSAPFNPYVVWKMDAIKFPINSNEIFFIAMVLGILSYVTVSLITQRKPFNLDRMLHRGIYSTGEMPPAEKLTFKSIIGKMVGIDGNYTRGDKIIAWSVFFYSFVYGFLVAFVGVAVWNIFSKWPLEWWSWYFFIVNLLIPGIVAIISTVWFTWGGTRDLLRMFRDLEAKEDNPLDDGRVKNGTTLADSGE